MDTCVPTLERRDPRQCNPASQEVGGGPQCLTFRPADWDVGGDRRVLEFSVSQRSCESGGSGRATVSDLQAMRETRYAVEKGAPEKGAGVEKTREDQIEAKKQCG